MKPPTGWLSLAILLVMMLTLTSAMQAMRWTPGLEILSPMVVCAVLVGTVLANREWLPALLAHGWSAVLAVAAAAYFGTFNLSDYGLAGGSGTGLVARMSAVRDICGDWLRRATLDLPADENVARFVFVLWLAALLWLVAYMAAWFLVRYANWWGSVLPSGFALLATLYNAPQDSLVYLAAFLLCALLLAGQANAALQVSRWTQQRIRYDPDFELTLLRDGLLLILAVLAIGFQAPPGTSPVAWQQWLDRIRGSGQQINTALGRLFPSLEVPQRAGSSAGQGFGNDLPLAGSIDLSSQPIFDARVEPDVQIRYWRMAVYDEFTGFGWRRSASQRLNGQVLESGAVDWAPLGIVVTQTITSLAGGMRQLVAVPQAIDFDVPVISEVASWQGQATSDVQTIQSASPLRIGDRYVVRSSLAVDDPQVLRQLTASDPEWIRDRYLGLPPSTTARTRALAGSLAAGATTRLDQAMAVEAYLRRIPYSLHIGSPPSGQDHVDWFLFDEQRGYCDYYASAFVVLVRSRGIPARLAAGYAVGDRVPGTSTYRQAARHAHTWPEVYFPGHGWVAFEPTASQRPLERGLPAPAGDDEPTSEPTALVPTPAPPSDAPDPASAAPAGEGSGPGAPDARRLWPLGAGLMVLCGVLVLVALGWFGPLGQLSPAEATFARLCRVATWLGFPPRATDTPHEYGRQLGAAWTGAEGEIQTIVDAYVADRYGRQRTAAAADEAATAWRRLRRKFARSAPRWGLARRAAGGHRPTGRCRPSQQPPPPDEAWL